MMQHPFMNEEEAGPNARFVDFKMRSNTASEICADFKLTDKEYYKISNILYEFSRIKLDGKKKELIQARLNKRLRELNLSTYSQYINLIKQDSTNKELTMMVDHLTTNLTYFYREPQHFDFFRENILASIDPYDIQNYRIWSAGCSSGEEPYSLAMTVKELFPDAAFPRPIILGTDISYRMLNRAAMGNYPEDKMKSVSDIVKKQYFSSHKAGGKLVYRVDSSIVRMIRFCHLNLMKEWPMAGKFDLIFCRNVMIYFDKKTQIDLARRFFNVLRPGGYLMIGHSESLNGISNDFKFVRPSVYIKE